jgi:hypothetical protein
MELQEWYQPKISTDYESSTVLLTLVHIKRHTVCVLCHLFLIPHMETAEICTHRGLWNFESLIKAVYTGTQVSFFFFKCISLGQIACYFGENMSLELVLFSCCVFLNRQSGRHWAPSEQGGGSGVPSFSMTVTPSARSCFFASGLWDEGAGVCFSTKVLR